MDACRARLQIEAGGSVCSSQTIIGNPIGCKVTLKGDKMYQFLDKMVEVVLPKMKEWPGLPESAGDATGNMSMGFPPSALSLFPEIESIFDMYPRMTEFHITFSTTRHGSCSVDSTYPSNKRTDLHQ
jgi:ribosomal protein L5